LSIWRDLSQLRDPARFDAWSYRLLVRACYAEAGTRLFSEGETHKDAGLRVEQEIQQIVQSIRCE
jgi:DNA-directed RNA polymerase specialized sigma24 family protein